jgi:hypothetical protein
MGLRNGTGPKHPGLSALSLQLLDGAHHIKVEFIERTARTTHLTNTGVESRTLHSLYEQMLDETNTCLLTSVCN